MVKEGILGELKKMKGGTTAGIDDVVVEVLKNEGISITDWLLRIFNRYMEPGIVPEEWKVACIVPIHKKKGDRRECVSYRRIIILSIHGKIYGRILICRVMESTK